MDSSEYKHLVLGLVFMKYLSDADAGTPTVSGVVVPLEARWGSSTDPEGIAALGSAPDLGRQIDQALRATAEANPRLDGVLSPLYANAPLSADALAELVAVINGMDFGASPAEARDMLGRVYEYFLKTFARAEGHRGGEFYTPACIVDLLVQIMEPRHGTILDPACGSGGLFVQTAAFVGADDNGSRLSLHGQEMNPATLRLARMNMVIHGLDADLRLGNSLQDDQFGDLRADFVLANPPFNMKKWGASRTVGDPRWRYGIPPDRNANFAWVQHFLAHLSDRGRAGFVLANGALTSVSSGEGAIRQELVEADVVDCVVGLPPQLFFTTAIPVSLWFLDMDKARSGGRDRRGEVLFIDARALGTKISRTQTDLDQAERQRISATYRSWRDGLDYHDVVGFARSATLAEVAEAKFRLAPSRYVGFHAAPVDAAVFEGELADAQQDLRAALDELDVSVGSVREILAEISG